VEWLATGEGQEEPNQAPDGYLNLRSFNLAATGNHLRGILDQFGRHPMSAPGRLIKQNDLVGRGAAATASLESYVVEQSGLDFEPEIHCGDVFLFTVPHGHQITVPSLVADWTFIEESGVYLLAIGVELKLRKLRLHKDAAKESLAILGPNGKTEVALSGVPRDLILFGRVTWRSGALPA
jgi:hypothetical protein